MTDYRHNPATKKAPEDLDTSEMRQGSSGRSTYYMLIVGTVLAVTAVTWVVLAYA
ncbi:MAG: hypothetical protein RH946_01540 [Rhodospirillales bacterium]